MTNSGEITAYDFRSQIQAGIAWLEQNRPGKLAEIDLAELDLYDMWSCVLGQTGGFIADDVRDSVGSLAPNAVNPWADARGFRVSDPLFYNEASGYGAAYAALTEQWREAIKSRLGALVPA
ncbi:hypothetical protein ACFQS3_02470 [Glycomyces mayteni]|uniref:Uncharacterized protein n=1 Tax=Glycomyces mayteni TaxID=543887 RepID=A0ABW2D4Y0_9ACTN|nr:hypothetical protein GCM10025732_47930 [Glycomyces mayteni]